MGTEIQGAISDLENENQSLRKELAEYKLAYSQQLEINRNAAENAARNEKLLQSLVEAAAGKIGQDFFDNIVIRLSEWLGAECVLIGKMTKDERIEAMPLYLDGEISHGFSYNLAGSPCDITTRKGYCSFSENVIDLFPTDKILVDLQAEGYIGSALYNKIGETTGVICAVSRHKLEVPPYARDIMKIIGARVTAEIERQKVEDALKQSEKDLRESNVAKDKFFSIIAHDLKNPLGILIGFSGLLMKNFDEYGKDKNIQYLDYINQTAQKVSELIQNLLAWALAQQGVMECVKDQTKLQPLVKESIAFLSILANEKNIDLKYDIPESITVSADVNMLSTVLRNLVSNAIKFTNEGGHILVSCRNDANRNEGKLIVCVEDSGIGIDKDKMKHLFKITRNTSSSGTHNESGTGLGLVLCKDFIEKQGGRIWAESSQGSGSRFMFTLDQVS